MTLVYTDQILGQYDTLFIFQMSSGPFIFQMSSGPHGPFEISSIN